MNAAREQLLRETTDAAQAVRELVLAHPVEPETTYRLGDVLRQLNEAHRRLVDAIAGYPHALASHPDTGGSDEAAYLLANLVSSLSTVVVRYHGQQEFLLFDRDTFPHALREVLVQATTFLAKFGSLDVDVHQYAQHLAADGADPRWRAATIHAAALAEGCWSRAVRPERAVHEIGLGMLAVSLFVVSVEHGFDFDPNILLPFRVEDLIDPVATDPMWARGPLEAVDRSLPTDERHRQIDQLCAERDERMAALTSRIQAALVLAGVDLWRPAAPYRGLVRIWRYLQKPAPSPEGSDLAINGYAQPYTWRPHLAEGAIRAREYLASNPLKPTTRPA